MNKHSADDELELLALVVHALLFILHFLAVIFNFRRAKRFDLDTTIHSAACIYDAASAKKHWERLINKL